MVEEALHDLWKRSKQEAGQKKNAEKTKGYEALGGHDTSEMCKMDHPSAKMFTPEQVGRPARASQSHLKTLPRQMQAIVSLPATIMAFTHFRFEPKWVKPAASGSRGI
ncbi:MAG: hypothetical protein JRI36_05055 [Deltaproteobacteria bacterium]|nr:hypothetical protein [Deltaproteobacteria bacterium]